jgi:hypothetical protein
LFEKEKYLELPKQIRSGLIRTPDTITNGTEIDGNYEQSVAANRA